MAKELRYTSSIKDMPFMFPEMRRTAQLLCAEKSSDEILQLSLEDNLYQLERERRRREVPQRMLNRLSGLTMPLVSAVAFGNEQDAKLVAFLALIKSDRLLFEYMREVYADQYASGVKEITDQDFMVFMERKMMDSPTVANWADATIASIRSIYKSILCEAGLARRSGDGIFIQKPVVLPELQTLLGEKNALYASAMLLQEG